MKRFSFVSKFWNTSSKLGLGVVLLEEPLQKQVTVRWQIANIWKFNRGTLDLVGSVGHVKIEWLVPEPNRIR